MLCLLPRVSLSTAPGSRKVLSNSVPDPCCLSPAEPAILPVGVFLVAEIEEQPSGVLLEDSLVLFGEDVPPVPGNPLSQERRRILLSSLPPGLALEAMPLYAA